MTGRLEKAAIAVLDEMPRFVGEPYPNKPDYVVSYIDCGEVDLRDLVRAALTALRSEGSETWENGAPVHFNDVIDAILNEPAE